MVPAQEIEREYIRLPYVVPGTQTFYRKIQQGTFLESLNNTAECKALSELCSYQKQFIIYLIALFDKKDKKKVTEIFDVLRQKLGSKFFEVPSKTTFQARKIEENTDTALHYAATLMTDHCDRDVIELLIKQGIDVNRLNHQGLTALNCAIERSYEVVFNALLDAGANVFPTETRTGVSLVQIPTAPLCQLLEKTGECPTTQIQSRMFAELIKRGANPNILTTNGAPAFMVALCCVKSGKVSDRLFERHIAELFLSSSKLDLSLKCTFSSLENAPYTALDHMILIREVRKIGAKILVNAQAGELVLKDHIIDKFAKRLVSVEKEILDTVGQFPIVIGSLISQYECADDKFQEYGTSSASVTFLYNILEDYRFKAKVREQRALLPSPKTVAV